MFAHSKTPPTPLFARVAALPYVPLGRHGMTPRLRAAALLRTLMTTRMRGLGQVHAGIAHAGTCICAVGILTLLPHNARSLVAVAPRTHSARAHALVHRALWTLVYAQHRSRRGFAIALRARCMRICILRTGCALALAPARAHRMDTLSCCTPRANTARAASLHRLRGFCLTFTHNISTRSSCRAATSSTRCARCCTRVTRLVRALHGL